MKTKTARSHREWRRGVIIGIISYTDLLLGPMLTKVVTAVPINENWDFAVSFTHLKLERVSFVSTVLDSIGIFLAWSRNYR